MEQDARVTAYLRIYKTIYVYYVYIYKYIYSTAQFGNCNTLHVPRVLQFRVGVPIYYGRRMPLLEIICNYTILYLYKAILYGIFISLYIFICAY